MKGRIRTVLFGALIAAGILGLGLLGLLGMFWYMVDRGAPPHPHSELLRSGELVGRDAAAIIREAGQPKWKTHEIWYDLGDKGDYEGLYTTVTGFEPTLGIHLMLDEQDNVIDVELSDY